MLCYDFLDQNTVKPHFSPLSLVAKLRPIVEMTEKQLRWVVFRIKFEAG